MTITSVTARLDAIASGQCFQFGGATFIKAGSNPVTGTSYSVVDLNTGAPTTLDGAQQVTPRTAEVVLS